MEGYPLVILHNYGKVHHCLWESSATFWHNQRAYLYYHLSTPKNLGWFWETSKLSTDGSASQSSLRCKRPSWRNATWSGQSWSTFSDKKQSSSWIKIPLIVVTMEISRESKSWGNCCNQQLDSKQKLRHLFLHKYISMYKYIYIYIYMYVHV